MLIKLATKVTAIKMVEIESLVLKAIDVNEDIYKKMVVYLIYYLLMVFIFNIKYLLIFYYKFF